MWSYELYCVPPRFIRNPILPYDSIWRGGLLKRGAPLHEKNKIRQLAFSLFLHYVQPYKTVAICTSGNILDGKTDSILLALDLGPP